MRIYRGTLVLKEHVYFASREIGILFATEPMIGNYALTYALGLCHAPYYWNGGPRYRQDLLPLNEADIYVTPAAFRDFYFAFQQFNAQTDTYYSRFDQNAIATVRGQVARPNNFPQNGKLRMLGLGSRGHFYLLNGQDRALNLPRYIRLGKFNSKARVDWAEVGAQPFDGEDVLVRNALNAADLPASADVRILSLLSVHPAPLVTSALFSGRGWRLAPGAASEAREDDVLPEGLRYGVEGLP